MNDKLIESLYLHFPFCRHLCNYCDFFKSVPKDRTSELAQYHHYLEQSYQVQEELMRAHGYEFAPLKTFYIGGGTPSLWGDEGALFLKDFFERKGLRLDRDCEFTLEVNPGTWNKQGLEAWRDFGVNRFSLGIQSFQESMLKVLDRVHSLQDVTDVLDFFHRWDVNFSVDFMLGLPKSDELGRDVIQELDQVLRYEPDHLSLYILTVKSNYVHRTSLPKEEWIEDEYLKVSQYLIERGYAHYEVSNFAKEGKKSEHNLSYWKSKTVAALGPSATGYLANDFLRYKWKAHSPQIEIENLSPAEAKLENCYMALRSDVGLELTPSQHSEALILKINDWKKRGLAHFENNKIYLTSKGYLVLDSLVNDLFILKVL